MSKITAIFYLVKDKHGNQDYAITSDKPQIVEFWIGGQFFEGYAHDLESWCEENGLEYKEVRKDFEFEELWEEQDGI